MNKTIAVIGSSRRDGNTGQLIDLIANQANFEVIDLTTKNISPYDYDQKNLDDDFLALMDQLLKFDNIIFVITCLLVFHECPNESIYRSVFRFLIY